MDFSLSGEQELIVSTIRRFVDRDIGAWAADADRSGAAPDRLLEVGGELGFLIDAVPAAADGLLEGDYCHTDRALRALELGRGCAAMAALLETNVEPALAVAARGTDEAQQSLYGALAGGAVATTAHDSWGRLTIADSGGAATVSGPLGPVPALAGASHLLLCARTESGAPIVLLVPTATGGIEVEAITPSGWRCARWGVLRASGAEVAPELILARGAEAAGVTADILAWYRVNLAARATGVATAAMEHARGYAEERVQFGQPIGTFESVARLRDRAETGAAAARMLTLLAAWQLDQGHPQARDTAGRARDLAAAVVSEATIDAVQIYGGYGFVNDYPVEKLMRDARAFEVLSGDEALERALSARADAQPTQDS